MHYKRTFRFFGFFSCFFFLSCVGILVVVVFLCFLCRRGGVSYRNGIPFLNKVVGFISHCKGREAIMQGFGGSGEESGGREKRFM